MCHCPQKFTSDSIQKNILSFLKFGTVVAKAYMLIHDREEVLIIKENSDDMEEQPDKRHVVKL